MKTNSMAVLRERLEQLETAPLDALLREELKKDAPDGQLVRLIGSILKERNAAVPEISPKVRQAWARYQRNTRTSRARPGAHRRRLVQAAALVLVLLCLMLLLPREASAKHFFRRVIDWTEDVFSLASPSETGAAAPEYRFRTDHPGLQQVYDQVTALGVTAPVVPMWLPEGYELTACTVTKTPSKSYITAVFFDGTSEAVYQLEIYAENVESLYSKDHRNIQIFEKHGIEHAAIYNNDFFVAVWATENVECFINIECREDILDRILESIYTMEDS